jgi:hypothetical protein
VNVVPAAGGSSNHLSEVRLALLRSDVFVLRQQRIPLDDLQQVVEIMGHASGQLTDRLHLLRLAELLFETHLIGDIGGHANPLDGLASGIPHRCPAIGPDARLATWRDHAIPLAVRGAGLQVLGDGCAHANPIVLVDHLLPVGHALTGGNIVIDQSIRAPEAMERVGREVPLVNDFRRELGRETEALFAVAQAAPPRPSPP